jgi:prolyl-tRNA editing enzyme YbaK/EbsC (Cys-tRNA(Pro) deacylase)
MQEMSTRLFGNIVNLLNAESVHFERFEHEPVFTSATASAVLKHPEEQGTKSLALISKAEDIVIVTVAGNERIDFKKAGTLLGIKRLSMCSPETLSAKLGTEIGGLAPFGYDIPVRLLVSASLLRQPFVYINPGQNNITIRLTGEAFGRVVQNLMAVVFETTED